MAVYEYMTNTGTGTVHLMAQGVPSGPQKTLCGREAGHLAAGDETLSGIAASCRSCRTTARTAQARPAPGAPGALDRWAFDQLMGGAR